MGGTNWGPSAPARRSTGWLNRESCSRYEAASAGKALARTLSMAANNASTSPAVKIPSGPVGAASVNGGS